MAPIAAKINPLVVDKFTSNELFTGCYVLLDGGKILATRFEAQSFAWTSFTEVLTVQNEAPSCTQSLCFIDEHFAFISTNSGIVRIYDTGNRQEFCAWKNVFEYRLTDLEQHNVPVLVCDIRQKSHASALEILLQTVVETEKIDLEHEKHKSSFANRLIWLTIEQNNGTFNITRVRQLNCAGTLEMATLDTESSTVVCVSEMPKPVFASDSLMAVKSPLPQEAETAMEAESATDGTKNRIGEKFYAWTQTDNKIAVYFKIAEEILQKNMTVRIASKVSHLAMFVNNVILVSGDLGGDIDPDSSEWKVENNLLMLTIEKANDTKWETFLNDDIHGNYHADEEQLLSSTGDLVPNKWIVSSEDSAPLFNSEQLELCDQSDNTFYVFWMDGDKHEMVRMVEPSGSKILFTTQLTKGGPLSFASRHDVHGIVWALEEGRDPPIQHKHTLLAFGFIQAGHEGVRFTGCSPDGQYATLINRRNHAFIYFQDAALNQGTELKNRKSGRVSTSVAKQVIFTLAQNDPDYSANAHGTEYVGFYAAERELFLLSQNSIYALNFREII
ncbi:CS domain-containing protein [Ditylenchus destructor]|nr:CS domain-containing protein [Ditylenchus destructor]